jgi:hypothetical protein
VSVPSLGTATSPGYFEDRILSWDAIPRGMDLGNDYALRPSGGRIVLDDSDRTLALKMLRAVRQPAIVYIASGESSAVSVIWTGVVDRVTHSGATWEVYLRQDDDWMKQEVPRRLFTAADFVNIDSTALNKPAPQIYGIHDATGAYGSKQGMLPTYYVDTSVFRFACCSHYLKSVRRVYLNGTVKTLGVDYVVEVVTVNAQTYTTIRFLGSPGANPVVTFDCDGIEDRGDGSGTLITNPSTQLRHWLNNWVVNTWTRHTYNGDPTPGISWFNQNAAGGKVDAGATSVMDLSFTGLGYTGARWIGDQTRTAAVEVNQWCKDWCTSPYWTPAGLLAWLLFGFRTQGTSYYSPPYLWREADDVIDGDISNDFEPSGRVRMATTRWAPSFATGSETFQEQEAEIDPRSPVRATLQRDCRWLPAATGQAGVVSGLGSRLLNRTRAVFPILSARMHLSALDMSLGDQGHWSWVAGIRSDGSVGWGDKPWQRVPCFLAELSLDLEHLEVLTKWVVLEDLLTSHWIPYYFDEVGKTVGNIIDGIAVLTVSTTAAVTRASVKYVEDVGFSGLVKLAAGVASVDRRGLLMEVAADNSLIRTAFDSGLAGWTTAVNGGTIATDATDLLFDPATSPGSIRIAATGALVGNCVIFQANAGGNFAINQVINVAVYHRDLPSTAGRLAVFIQRAVDGFFWNGAAWAAPGVPAVKFTHSAGVVVRDSVRNINVGANATGITVFIGIEQATVVAGQDHRVFHVQLEKGAYSTSPIVNTAAMVARAADALSRGQDGNQGFFVMPQTQGTIEMEVATEWGTGEFPAGRAYLFDLKFNGTNEWAIYYDSADGKVHFVATSAGLSYDAAVTPPAGGPFTTRESFGWVIVRWTGAQNELDVTGPTLTIAVSNGDGTTSGLATASFTNYVTPATVAGQSIFEGVKADSTSQLSGWLRNLRIMPDVKLDSYVLARHKGALLV